MSKHGVVRAERAQETWEVAKTLEYTQDAHQARAKT